jgi:hypothetical protein
MTKKPKKKRKDLSSTPAKAVTQVRSAIPLSDRSLDVLDALAVYGDWARPMDIGGRDGSHHSVTLSLLSRRQLAERKKVHALYCYHGSTQRKELVDNRWVYSEGHPPSTKCCCKGSCLYRILPAGRAVLGDLLPDGQATKTRPE